jgi:NitT/TauT family transport system permease protein
LGDALTYLWAGWGAAASLLLLVALWEAGHAAYGTLVLPSPRDTFAEMARMAAAGRMLPAAAGASDVVRRLLQPIATLMLGIPAIAWVVLSLLWFGGSGLAAPFTVVVTTAPIVFAGSAQGVRTLDGALLRMARAFRAPGRVLVWDVYLPHMASYLFPSLATARVQVDTVRAMAWVVVVVALLLAVEYLALEPLRRHLQTWRREPPAGGDGGAPGQQGGL